MLCCVVCAEGFQYIYNPHTHHAQCSIVLVVVVVNDNIYSLVNNKQRETAAWFAEKNTKENKIIKRVWVYRMAHVMPFCLFYCANILYRNFLLWYFPFFCVVDDDVLSRQLCSQEWKKNSIHIFNMTKGMLQTCHMRLLFNIQHIQKI